MEGERGTTTSSSKGSRTLERGEAGGRSARRRRARGYPQRWPVGSEGPAPPCWASGTVVPAAMSPAPEPSGTQSVGAGASTAGSDDKAASAISGEGGPQTGGTEGNLPVDADLAEAVSAGEPRGGDERRLRARPARRTGRVGERPRLPSPVAVLAGSGQSLAWCPLSRQLKHLAGLVQSALTWFMDRQLKHLPTKFAGTGRRGTGARRHRRRLSTALNPSASGARDMRRGCTTMEARRRGCSGGALGERRAPSTTPLSLRGRRRRRRRCFLGRCGALPRPDAAEASESKEASESEKDSLPPDLPGEPTKGSASGSNELECSTMVAWAAAASGGRLKLEGVATPREASSASTSSAQDMREQEPGSMSTGSPPRAIVSQRAAVMQGDFLGHFTVATSVI